MLVLSYLRGELVCSSPRFVYSFHSTCNYFVKHFLSWLLFAMQSIFVLIVLFVWLGVVQVRHVDGYPILYHPIRGSNQKSQLSQQPPHQPLQPQTSSPVLVSSINSTTSTATVTSNQSLEDSTPIVQTVGRFKVSTNKLSPFNNVVPRQSVSLSSSPATGSVVTGSGLSGPPKYTTCCSVDESIRKGSLNENGLYTLKNSQSQPELR